MTDDQSWLDYANSYLSLLPQAVQDPAFYQLMFGINPETAASQDISGQNDLVKMGAGALQGLATIGNTFGNAVDPLARAIEARVGPVTMGGLFPTVDQAAQTRAQGRENFNALYGGSIPAAIGKDMGLEALGGPLVRATGAALPYAGAAVNRLLQGPVASRVAGNALTGAGYGVGLTGLGASDQEGNFADNLVNSALFGAGFGVVNAAKSGQPPFMTMSGGAKPSAEPVAPRQGREAVYSKLEDTITKGEGAPKTAPPDKWLQYLNGAQARGLMTKEERADIGIDDWLEEKAELGQPVTRQELQQFVADNTPRFQTVVPGGGMDNHALSEIMYTADIDAQRAGMQSLITSLDNGYFDGYDELPAMQALVTEYGGDVDRMAIDADLTISSVGAAMLNGLEPPPADMAKARRFYDAFALAQEAEAGTPNLTFEQLLNEAGGLGLNAYSTAFKKAFPALWANTYYDNALDSMQRQVDDPATQRAMGDAFAKRLTDRSMYNTFVEVANDPELFKRLLGPYLADDGGQATREKLSGFLNREQYNSNYSERVDNINDMLRDNLGPGAVYAVENYARDRALENVANRYLAEKPRYGYYQWDKGNARDYHERILQLQTPYDTPESKAARAKELGYTVFQSDRNPDIYYVLPPGSTNKNDTVAQSGGYSPDEALAYWAANKARPQDLQIEKPYTHAHWDEENPIAHWRANVRDNLVDDGVPSYHIEEIQSDWHQQAGTAAREVGRDDYTGYRPKPGSKAQKQYDKLAKELGEAEVASSQAWKAWDKQQDEADRRAAKINAGGGTDADMKAYEEAMAELRRLEVTRDEARTRVEAVRAAMPYVSPNTMPYPDAPFKNSWEQLVLKNALKEAVDRDLTRVSWTPGELQSTATGQEKNRKGNDERYNKRVVNYMNDIGKKYGTKVQFKPMVDSELAKLGLQPAAYVQPGPVKADALFLIVDNPLERGKYIIAPKRETGRPMNDRDEALFELMGKVKKYVGDTQYKEIKGSSYESIEAAEQAVKGMLNKLPKIPYMNLTPRLIEDVKAGKLSMY